MIAGLIRLAPIRSAESLLHPERVPAGRRMFGRGELQLRADSPLLVDHDRRIGIVRELVEINDVGGPWLAARVLVEDPPAWLRRGTKASFGSVPLSDRAIVDEVSVLSTNQTPVEPLAEVLYLEPKLRSVP